MSGASAGDEVLVAVDVGTSGARAAAFDLAGHPVAAARRPYPTAIPRDGWAEQAAQDWRHASIGALAALVRDLTPGRPVLAIGADAVGIPVRVVPGDATAAGVAMLAGLRAGVYGSPADAVAAAREPSTLDMFAAMLTDGDSLHAPVVACLDVGHMCVPGTSGDDRGPYAWLRRLGARAPIVQLQQSDGLADHHWPFTAARNAGGIIDAGRVLAALDESGAERVRLILEVIPPFEQDDGTVTGELRESCDYRRAAMAAHGRG